MPDAGPVDLFGGAALGEFELPAGGGQFREHAGRGRTVEAFVQTGSDPGEQAGCLSRHPLQIRWEHAFDHTRRVRP